MVIVGLNLRAVQLRWINRERIALFDDLLFLLVGGVAVLRAAGAHAGEVDAELLGRAQQVVVLVAHFGAGALLGDDVDVERQRLHLLQEDLEGLGDRRLGDVLALDDRLVGLDAPDRVVGLDREHLLQRVRGAVGLERPHLHLAEALAAELRLAAQRLLGDERVRARGAGVDLVVHQVQELEHVEVADRDLAVVLLARAPVVQHRAARALAAVVVVGVDREADAVVEVRLLVAHERLVDLLRCRAVENRRGDELGRRAVAAGHAADASEHDARTAPVSGAV